MSKKSGKRIGQIMVERGFITPAALNAALKKQACLKTRTFIGDILVDAKACDEEMVAKALAEQYGVKYVKLDDVEVPNNVIFPKKADLSKYCIFPVGVNDNGQTVFATAIPFSKEFADLMILPDGRNLALLPSQDLMMSWGIYRNIHQIDYVIASREQICKAIETRTMR